MNAEDYGRVHLIVSGRVQGVFFRASAAEQARALGISGWANNLSTGEVEILAEGRRTSLKALIAWSHQGPPAANVTNVTEEWAEFRREFNGFRIR